MSFVLFNFETTSYCNAKCPSCFRTANLYIEDQYHGPIRHFKHLSVEDFEEFLLNNSKYLNSIKSSPGNKKYDLVVAKFCGEIGDPLMHPEMDKLVSLASMVFNRVEIFTNGGLRNPEWINQILNKNNNLYFVFGIDGVTDEINQKYRIGVRTDLAFSNMLMSVKQRDTKWDFTVFEHNYHQLQDAIDFAEKHEIYINVRINGRPYSKLKKEKISLVEDILKKNSTNYYLCKGAISV